MKYNVLRKAIAYILTFVMVMSCMPSTIFAANPSDFTDFPTGWSAEAVTAAVNNGLLNGRSPGKLEPAGYLTRAEMATIINRAFGATIEKDISHISDVNYNDWFYHEIAKAYNMQTFEGYEDGTMRPDNYITREEVFAVIARALVLESNDYSPLGEFNDAYYVSDWAKPYTSVLVAKNYVNGDNLGNLNPKNNITREEFAQMMHNIVKTYYTQSSTYKTVGADCALIRTGNVILSDVVIEGDLILGDGVGRGDVTLTNVTIKGRLLARGGEGNVTLTNTTVGEGVVVKDVNGIVHFNNYRDEAPFEGIREITPATFIPKQVVIPPSGGGSGGGGSSSPSKVEYTIYHYAEDSDGSIEFNGLKYKEYKKKSGEVDKGKTVKITEETIPGYELDTESGDGSKAGTSVKVNSKTSFKLYYNLKKYSVDVVLPDGTTQNLTYKHGEKFGANFNMEAYPDAMFYYVAVDGETLVEVTPHLTITSAITVFSKQIHTVRFDYNDASGRVAEVKVPHNENVGSKMPTPERKGYELAGWNTRPDGSGSVFNEATDITGPVTVYALWNTVKYSITYNSKFGFVSPVVEQYDIETSVALPTEADFEAHDNFIFDGWYKEDSFKTKVNSIEVGTTGNIVLYARWLDISVTYHDVSFDLNYTGAPAATSVKVADGETVAKPSDPSRNGYSFDGWYTTSEALTAYDFSKTVESDITVYAKWILNTYTITYNTYGGTFKQGAHKPETFTVESLPVLLPTSDDIAYIGYDFKGWYTDSALTMPISQIAVGTLSNVTVYAKWQPKTYTVVIKTPGAPDQEKIFVHGQTIGGVIPVDPVRTGYKFTGYNTSEDGTGTNYSKTDKITESITLYTQWVATQYKVNYNLNGGSIKNASAFDNDYTIEESITLPVADDFTEREGYTFKGWFRNYELTDGPVASVSTGTTGDLDFWAKWEKNTYKVTFVVDGTPSDKTYTHGDKISTQMSDPAKFGYNFEGWYTQPNGEGTKYTGNSAVTSANTLYAYWTVNKYTITYKLNGATMKNEAAFKTSYTVNDSFTLPVMSDFNEYEGYTFTGWYKNSDFSGVQLTNIAGGTTGSFTLYAKWEKKTYSVTFVTDGVSSTKGYTHGDKISAQMSDPSKNGYTFAGWYTQPNGEGTKYTKDSAVTGSNTLYAHWNPVSYDVEYKLGDGSVKDGVTLKTAYNIEETFALPTANDLVAPEGHEFKGWFRNADFTGGKVTNVAAGTTGKLTFWAKWSKTSHTVNFNVDGIVSSKTYTYGDKLSTLMADPVKNAYDFVGWNTAEDGSGTNYTKDSAVKSDLTLYAQWKAASYTITYNLGGGEKLNSSAFVSSYNIETAVTLPVASDFKPREGLTFVGWYKDASFATTSLTEIPLGSSGNITLYARWEKNTYTVIFDVDGVTTDKKYVHGEKISVNMTDPSKEGFEFTGWNTASDGTGTAYQSSDKVTSPLTLYAQFKAIKYTITYDLGSGHSFKEGYTPVTEFYVTSDDIILPTAADIKESATHEFYGWYLDSAHTQAISKVDKGTSENIKVYAKWNEKTKVYYDVVFSYNYADAPQSGEYSKLAVESGMKIGSGKPADPSRKGYKFEGWYADESCTSEFDFDTAISTDTTIYAKWTKETYSITYDLGGASKGNDAAFVSSYDVETSFTLPAESDFALRPGYKFKGWFDNAEFTGTPVTSVSAGTVGNKKFYAQWEKESYTITYETYGAVIKNSEAFKTSYTVSDNVALPVLADFEEREAYTFLGWYDNASFAGEALTSISAGSTGNKTLHAKWEKKTYSVTFVVDGIESTVTYEHGDLLSYNAPNPAKDGYTFKEWNTSSTGVGIVYSGNTAIRQTVTLYAVWNAIAYEIEYVLNEGNIKNTSAFVDEYNIETEVILPTADDFEENAAYEFKGWYTDSAFLSSLVTSVPVGSMGDRIFYAKWEKKSYDVTFNVDGTETKLNYQHGETIGPKFAAPSKSGYNFTGWNTELNGTGDSYTQASAVEKGLTLYAQWSIIDYSIKYNMGGASQGSAAAFVTSYNTEKSVTLPKEADFAGMEAYTFLGWYDNIEYAGDPVANIPLGSTGNREYWAKWEIKTFNVTFIVDGLTTQRTYTYGDTIGSKMTDPTKAAYTFSGWNTSENGLGIAYTQASEVKSELTLYAQWNTIRYTISYNLNDGVIKNPAAFADSYDVETSVTLPAGDDFETREGYKFLGWYETENFTGEPVAVIPAGVTGNKEYWARWEKNIYTVTFNVNGSVSTKDYRHDEKISDRMAEPSVDGYEFVGWNTASDGSGADYQHSDKVTSGITLYAKLNPIKYNIVYSRGKIPGTDTVFEFKDGYTPVYEYYVTSEDIVLPVASDFKEYEDYEFYAWYKNPNFTQKIDVIEKGSTGNITVFAKWIEKAKIYHDVTFSYNYDGAPQSGVYSKVAVESGKLIAGNKPVDPERLGYEFGGWYKDAACTESFNFLAPVNSETTVYAKWTVNEYVISFVKSGGAFADEDSVPGKYTVESEITLPVSDDFIDRPGYVFKGWYNNIELDGTPITTIEKGSTGDKTFYAKWEKLVYTITYDKGEGVASNASAFVSEYTVTDEVVLPVESDFVTREGYSFAGWYNNAEFTGDAITSVNAGTVGNITLWAKWVENEYDVTISVNGTETTYKYKHGETVSSQITNPQLTGYTFRCWNTKEDSTGSVYNGDTRVKESVTLYAIFDANSYKIEYNAPDATSGTGVYTSNHTYGVSKALTANKYSKAGYSFNSWKYEATDGTSVYYTDGQEVLNITAENNAVIKLYAVWNANTYTVKYEGNGATDGVMNTSSHTYDADAALNQNTYTRTGYTFLGWAESSDATSAKYTDMQSVKNLTVENGKEVVLYAVWSESTYTVKYDGNGATGGTMTDSVYGYTESKPLSTNAYSKTGHIFLGWSADPTSIAPQYTDGQTVSCLTSDGGTVTLYAVWQVKTYKLVFDVNGGIAFNEADLPAGFTLEDGKATVVVSYGSTYPELPSAEHSDNKLFFGGWHIGSELISAGQTVGDLTLTTVTAKWSDKLVHTVVYNEYNADGTSKQESVINGETIVAPATPSREGYSFGGWYTDRSYTTLFDFGKVVESDTVQTINVYVKWDANTYTVTIDSDNGTTPVTLTVKHGDKVSEPAVPEKDGFIFAGWFADDAEYDFTLPVTSDLDIIAKWETKPAESYNITYVLNGGEKLDEAAFVSSYTSADEVILPTASSFKERDDGNAFAGWYDNEKLEGEPVTTIPAGSSGAKTFWAKWNQSFIVTFYEGAIEDDSMYISEKKVAAGTSMAQSDIDDAMSTVLPYDYPEEGYKDGSYTHLIYPDLWYVTSDGTWELFDDTVVVNSNMNVFYSFKSLSLYFDIEIGDFKLAQPVSFSVPYSRDTRVMDSVKDAMYLARNQIDIALSIDDIYTKAIAEASGKSRDVIDSDGNLKYVNVDTAISNIIKASEIDGEIAEYIKEIIVSNNDDEKLNSAMLMVHDSDLMQNDVLGGEEYDFATVKAFIDALSVEERETFADKLHEELAKEQYYIDFIDGFEKGHDHFIVSHENINFVMAVANAVSEYTYEELKDRIYAKFGKVIDVLGDDIAREFMEDAQSRYHIGAEHLWDEFMANQSDEDYTADYPSYLTFRLNAIEHLFKPVYIKAREKALTKLTEDNIYYYADNPYMQQLIDIDPDTLVGDLFYTVPKTEDNIGYALWPSVSGESGFLHYYDYMYEKVLLFDKAMLWYKDNLSSAEFEALQTKIFADASRFLNKANETLDAYEKDGSLPLDKNVSDLMEIEAFAKLFNRFEDKIAKGLNKYKETQFYGKTWDAESLRKVKFAEDAVKTALGADDPVFNVDSLMDRGEFSKAIEKAGFKDFEDSFDQDMGYTVTVQAIERIFKENHIKVRRFHW